MAGQGAGSADATARTSQDWLPSPANEFGRSGPLESDVSQTTSDQTGELRAEALVPLAARRSTRTDDDRPPFCPVCHRRLVILTTHIARTATGERSRYQLWGCPRGHAMSRRMNGAFTAVEVLPDPLGSDDGRPTSRPVPLRRVRPDRSQLR